jgi:cytochrome P450
LNCPPVDKLLWKNPAFLFLGKIGWYNKVTPTVPFAHRHITARLSAMEKAYPHDSVQAETKQVDLLDKFLRAKQEHPDIVNDRAVLGLTLSMVNAGSDTTATTLAAIFFYLLKAPACMRKVYEELDAHFGPPRDLHSCVTSFADAQKLTYLDACIKETFRLHPALGGQLAERVVPSGGAYIAGEWVPEGTQVSCNSWTAHRHKPTFGADAEIFRPERWLESREEQLSAMNRALIAFGAGPHTCVGKNIALLEIYKLVPSVLRAFSVSIHPVILICHETPPWWYLVRYAVDSVLSRFNSRTRALDGKYITLGLSKRTTSLFGFNHVIRSRYELCAGKISSS